MKNFNKRDLLPPSGFPELSVAESVAIREVTEIIRHEYELAGFTTLETSIVERPEVLYASSGGEIQSQGYGLRLLNPPVGSDDDSKDLGLRYDHTVPLARFVAAHQGEIQFPFRRHAIGPVFRGERAKDGRYRQFTQADIDIIGSEKLDLLHDAEMVAVIARVFNRLHMGKFTVRIGHRKVLQGLLEVCGLSNIDAQTSALQEIDRLEKIGATAVHENLVKLGISQEKATQLLHILNTSNIEDLASLTAENALLHEGVEELREVLGGIEAYGVAAENYRVDLTIARGLAYYTGTVYETMLDAHPALGSIASGGRYEDLAGAFTNKILPGVGISIGVTRLMKRLIQAGLYEASRQTSARVLIVRAMDTKETRILALQTASHLRTHNIANEVYIEPAKLGKQMQFADRRGFETVIIIGDETLQDSNVTVRNLATGNESVISIAELSNVLK